MDKLGQLPASGARVLPSGWPNPGDTDIPGSSDLELFVVCKVRGESLPEKVEEEKGRGRQELTAKAPQNKNDPLGELHGSSAWLYQDPGSHKQEFEINLKTTSQTLELGRGMVRARGLERWLSLERESPGGCGC